MTRKQFINSGSYWDSRFKQDWEELQGPAQSRFFSRLAIENLPGWLIDQLQRQPLTLCDWGCAQGDGTDVWANYVDSNQITGIDFSPIAIKQATQRYPSITFLNEDWLVTKSKNNSVYDVVFSSNTLEHFHKPHNVLNVLCDRASKAVVLALPYRELERHQEHFYTFLPENIQSTIANNFRLAWSKVIDCRKISNSLWGGDQIVLVYAKSEWIDSLGLRLKDLGIEQVEYSSEIHSLNQTVAQRGDQIEELNQTVSQRDTQIEELNQTLAQRGDQIEELNQAVTQRDTRIEELNQTLAQRGDQIEELNQTVTQRDTQIEELNQTVTQRGDQIEELNQTVAQRERQLAVERSEKMRISNWAAEIHESPTKYTVKKNSLRIARSVFHLIPLPKSAKHYLKRAFSSTTRPFRNSRHTDSAQAQIEYTVAQSNEVLRPTSPERDVFVFAVIDWHFRIQRPQHIARSLAESGKRVFYFSNHFVDADEPGYELERLSDTDAIYQIKLHVNGAPAIYFDSPSEQALTMLTQSIAKVIRDFGALSSISIVQHSYWYPLVKRLPNSYRIYDCMDHHEGFGNVPEKLVEIEKEMLSGADLVTVTSSWLEDFASEFNSNVALIRNATEYDHFATQPCEIFQDDKGRQIIGYYGAIAEWFDLDLIRATALGYPNCLILLVGNDTVRAQKVLADLANVEFTGEVPYATLPFYLHAFDVCLLPFKVIPLTLATNPVKVYEYLAAGKPVVCVDLPEVSQFGDYVSRACSADDFVQAVGASLEEAREISVQKSTERRLFASNQTWSHRALELSEAIKTVQLPKVSVIILTYNNLELTRACLDSVITYSDYPNLEVIVVDNASSDDTPTYLEEFNCRYPDVRVVLNHENLGFAAGNNVGLSIATGDYLVLLNNDTVVTKGWVMTLLRHFQNNPNLGGIGPVTNNIGNEARIDTRYQEISDMPAEAQQYTLTNMGKTYPLRTAAFFCFMMPRSVYELCGPISEDYGRGFFEDDDYCRRIESIGKQIFCAEDVFVHHHLSASFNKLKDEERSDLFQRNKEIFESKWGLWIPHRYRGKNKCR